MTITPEKVADLAAKATPGPYQKHVQSYAALGFSIVGVMARDKVLMQCDLSSYPVKHADLDFMAAAPDMAELIAAQAAEIERLRVGLSDLIDHVEAINSEWDAIALQEARQALKDQTQ